MSELLHNVHARHDAWSLGSAWLIVGSTSCWKASCTVAELIPQLPRRGTRESYAAELASAGCRDAPAVVARLEALGVLLPRQSLAVRAWAFLKEPVIPLLKGSWVARLFPSPLLSALFAPRTIAVVAFLFAAMVLALLLGSRSPGAASPRWHELTPLWVLLGILAHELGHSAACAHAGLGFRPIGLTWYLIWPVAYTNVSGVEVTSRGHRALISLGGIYFQAIATILFFAIGRLWPESGGGGAVRILNILLLFNLNPFIQSDGYWCVKDLVDLEGDSLPRRIGSWFYQGSFVAFTLFLTWKVGVRFMHMLPRSIDELLSRILTLTPGQAFSLALLLYMQVLVVRGLARRFAKIARQVTNSTTPPETLSTSSNL